VEPRRRIVRRGGRRGPRRSRPTSGRAANSLWVRPKAGLPGRRRRRAKMERSLQLAPRASGLDLMQVAQPGHVQDALKTPRAWEGPGRNPLSSWRDPLTARAPRNSLERLNGAASRSNFVQLKLLAGPIPSRRLPAAAAARPSGLAVAPSPPAPRPGWPLIPRVRRLPSLPRVAGGRSTCATVVGPASGLSGSWPPPGRWTCRESRPPAACAPSRTT